MVYQIKKIPFNAIRDYWIEVNHFHIPNKIITEQVTQLGPYKSDYKWGEQKTQAYGLFCSDYIIGATQILEWDNNTIRWRTNNIRKEYRGKGLFYRFLSAIIINDWSNKDLLIGWFRQSAMWWPPKYNFVPFDNQSHKHDGDIYTMVKKPIAEIIEDHKYYMLT